MALQCSEELGRHLVAARDIPAGTILMREVPLVAIPTPPPLHESCVGCFATVPLNGPMTACQRCGWPVCEDACSLKEAHVLECSAFQRAGFKYNREQHVDVKVKARHWDALAALRVCLAKQTPQGLRLSELQCEITDPSEDSTPWSNGMALLEARSVFRSRLEAAAAWLRDQVGVDWLPSEDLRRALGAVLINTLCASSPIPIRKVGGLFAGHSLLEHACIPNCFSHAWQVPGRPSQGLERVLVAARPVARGEHLALSYLDDSFRGTADRQLELRFRGFLCHCKLCADDTELGLRLAAWHCGYCQREGRRCLVSLPELGRWSCDGCGREGTLEEDAEGSGRAEAERLERRMVELHDREELEREEWESLITEGLAPGGPLHPTHFVVLQVKGELTVGRAGLFACLRKSDREVLLRFLAHSRDLLRVLDVIRPGASPFRRVVIMRQMSLINDILALPGPRDKLLEKELKALSKQVPSFIVDPLERSLLSPQET